MNPCSKCEKKKGNGLKKFQQKQINRLKTQLANADKVIDMLRCYLKNVSLTEYMTKDIKLGAVKAVEYALTTYDKSMKSATTKEPKCKTCKTCNDKHEVGDIGREINCPTCTPFPGHKPFKPENLKTTVMRDSAGYPVKVEESIPATPQPSWIQVVRQAIWDIDSSVNEGDISLQEIMDNLRNIIPPETGVQTGEVIIKPSAVCKTCDGSREIYTDEKIIGNCHSFRYLPCPDCKGDE